MLFIKCFVLKYSLTCPPTKVTCSGLRHISLYQANFCSFCSKSKSVDLVGPMRRRHRGCVASPKAVKRGKGGDRCVLPLATSAASTLPSVGYLHCSITLLQLLVKLRSCAASTLPIECWLLTLLVGIDIACLIKHIATRT